MKAFTRNKVRLAIVTVCAVLFIVPSFAAAEETLLLASLTRTRQTEEFKNFDFFPDYHREARMKAAVQEAKKMETLKKVTLDEKIVKDAEWLSENAIIPYEIITTDYVGLIDRVLSR